MLGERDELDGILCGNNDAFEIQFLSEGYLLGEVTYE